MCNAMTRLRRYYPPLALLAGISLCCGCQVASHGQNVEGTRLFQQGDYQGASDRFQQSIANDPQNPDGYYNIAATYHRLWKLRGQETDATQAENFYNQCLDHDPDHADCYRGLAVLLVETKRSDAAFRLMEGWVTRSPALPDAKVELARLYDEFGNPDAAKARLQEALALDPSHSRALTALGKLREEAGEHLQALQIYERSLAVNRFQPHVATRVAALQSSFGPSTGMLPPANTRVVRDPNQWSRY